MKCAHGSSNVDIKKMYKKEITCGSFVIAIGSKSQDNSGMIIIVYTTVGNNSERVIFNFFQDKAFKICMYCYNRVMNLKLTWTKEGGYYI